MSTTINKEEIQKFSRLADEWWDVNGKFKPFICLILSGLSMTEKLKNYFNLKDKTNFLEGLNILDIGCVEVYKRTDGKARGKCNWY